MNHAQSARDQRARRARRRRRPRSPAARQQLATNQSLTDGTTVEKHPNVERAAAKVREAYLAYARADAAGAGVGLRRQAHRAGRPARRAGRAADVDHPARPGLGRRELQGSPAAPDAHRPAGDADRRRLRQQRRVPRHGRRPRRRHRRAFALLPAQNATGNWIKVVQRVPVRIALDPKELAAASAARRPVDGGRRSTSPTPTGATLAAAPRVAAPYTTAAFTHDAEDADALVRKTIAANLGAGAAIERRREPPRGRRRQRRAARRARRARAPCARRRRPPRRSRSRGATPHRTRDSAIAHGHDRPPAAPRRRAARAARTGRAARR